MKKPRHIKGTGSIFSRPGSPYLYIGYWNGKRFVKESAKTTDEQVAQALLDKRREQVRHKRHVDPRQQERVTVDELLGDLTRSYELHEQPSLPTLKTFVKALRVELGDMRVVNVSTPLLESLQLKWKQGGDANSTINKRLGALHRAFVLGVKNGRIAAVPPFPTRLEELSAIRQGFVEPADFSRFLAALPDDGLRDYVQWLGMTGMRRGEAGKLQWRYVRGNELHIPATDRKNRRPATLPLVGTLREIIDRRREARKRHPECPYIFHRDGQPVSEFRKPWNHAVKATGLSLIPHDLCRSAMRNLVRAGVPEKVAMEIAGRKTRSIFDRYHIVSTEQMAEGLAQLSRYTRRQTAKAAKVAKIG